VTATTPVSGVTFASLFKCNFLVCAAQKLTTFQLTTRRRRTVLLRAIASSGAVAFMQS